MTPFETAFPGFIQACVALFEDLLPFGVILLVIGTILEQAHSPSTPEAVLKIYAKAFVILLLLFNSAGLVNDGQQLVKRWVEENIPARPENVAERYRERLSEVQQLGDRADESFLRKVLHGDWYDAIILAVLTLLSWLAMAVMAFVYSVQRALLIGCWALSPLFVAFITIRPLSFIGLQHVLRLLGIILWPVGLALAATFTDGLIDVIAGGTRFAEVGWGEAIGKGLTALLGIGVLALWIIVSTILAPILIQRMVSGFGGVSEYHARGAQLLSTTLALGSMRLWQSAQAARSSDPASVSAPAPDISAGATTGSGPSTPPAAVVIPADPSRAAEAILQRELPSRS